MMKSWGMEIGSDKKFSVPQKTWLAVLLALAVWAGVILIIVLLVWIFRGAPAAGDAVSSSSAAVHWHFHARF